MRAWAVAIVAMATVAGAATPSGTPASRAAVATCERAEAAAADERPAMLRAGLEQANAAIAADDTDALAHFAAFCALGRLLRSDGIGFAAPFQLRRLRREIDRTLELAPDFGDALMGKGALLVNLPRLLGGDAAEGERLLRRSVGIDPDAVMPRLHLVEALRARGAVDEARAEAERALANAERAGNPDGADEARAHLRALGAPEANP